MQQFADIYLLQSYSTYFGVSQHSRVRLAQTSPDQTTLEGSSGTSSMTCIGGCGYSF